MSSPTTDFAVAAKVRTDGPHRSMAEDALRSVLGRPRGPLELDSGVCCTDSDGGSEPILPNFCDAAKVCYLGGDKKVQQPLGFRTGFTAASNEAFCGRAKKERF